MRRIGPKRPSPRLDLGSPCRRAVQSITTLFAHQHSLRQRWLDCPARRVVLVQFQLLLRQCKRRLANQGGHRGSGGDGVTNISTMCWGFTGTGRFSPSVPNLEQANLKCQPSRHNQYAAQDSRHRTIQDIQDSHHNSEFTKTFTIPENCTCDESQQQRDGLNAILLSCYL
jgi:hypothetical protein